MQISKLIEANIYSLKTAEDILLSLSDEQFQAIVEPFTSNLGKHLRHITDHYQLFMSVLADSGVLDYDSRARDCIEETERSAMILRLRKLQNQLDQLCLGMTEDFPLEVSLAVDEGIEAPRVPSSFSRELVFLQSHTVHHFAIIAAILKLQNVHVDAEFGIAPSTLKYEHQQKCAP